MNDTQKTIHWLGAGLASVPGIRRLIASDYPLRLWETDLAKAQSATRSLKGNFTISQSEPGALAAALMPGDVVVCMLPTAMHLDIAKLCMEKGAHYLSSSYATPEVKALDAIAKSQGLCIVNEVGLDPGIDHMLAHLLMDDYRHSAQFDPANEHDFQSFCGGFPAIANDFKYKFSWSPVGVLLALKSPARAILDGKQVDIDHAWDAIETYGVDLEGGYETFQSYPNRNSLDFMAEYGFTSDWNVQRFVRGTLRLDGWADAWGDIFKTIEMTPAEEQTAMLSSLSERLWADHAYEEGERDRVVMVVELKVMRDGATIWHKSKSIDAYGAARGSAMARLVSIPLSLATEAVFKGELAAGLQTAPHDPSRIRAWLETISEHGDHIHHVDHSMEARYIAAE